MSSLCFQTPQSGLPKSRLFICDVDRTLLTHDHVLLPQVASAARSLQIVGVPLVLASARSPTGVSRIHADVGADDTVCCFNGAWIGKLSSRETVKESRLNRAMGLEAMIAIHKIGGSPIWFTLDCGFVLESDEAVARRRTDVTGDNLQCIDRPDQAPEAPFKLLGTFPAARIGDAVSQLSAQFSGYITVAQSGPNLVEFVSLETRKDIAAAFIAGELGLSATEVAAAGDSDNDLHMLNWAGLAVTVANAKPHIREIADIIAPSCDEGGLALALDWFVTKQSEALDVRPSLTEEDLQKKPANAGNS